MDAEEVIELEIWRTLNKYDITPEDAVQAAHAISDALAVWDEWKKIPKPTI